jgi:PKD repeat protein
MRRTSIVGALTAALALAGTATLVSAAPAAPPTTPPGLADLFERPLPAAQALGRLGSRVSAIEARNGHLPPAQVAHLLSDRTTWADRGGRLFVVEPAPATRNDDPVLGATGDPAMAFELQSRPGASRTIYLDFDGETISGTAWNASYNGGATYYADPFDMDGSPSSFSTAERNVVTSVWQRVAEDYAPFDVNVTTKDPGSAAITRSGSTDQVYGTRVVISNTSIGYSSCGCGGVAYVGTFDITSNHAYYQPAWVFQRGVGTGAKYIAEAASHEAGHNLGLSHDGTSTQGYYAGHGSWAPIMGVGYSRAITQWSKGEYSGANQLQDDLVVMQQNGAPLRTDDHGNTAVTATALGAGPVDVSALIGTASDVDVYSFTSGEGTVSLTANPAAVSPNLDIALQLRDASGALVATSDPPSGSTNGDTATGLSASLSVTVAAGSYTLWVDGVGAGSPLTTGYSDYASLGRYSLSGTIPTPAEPPPPPPPPPPNEPQPPTAVISANPISGTAPLTVSFSAAGSTDPDNDIASYAWDFGDGATGSGITASRTYVNSGASAITRTVTLTVTDSGGRSSTAQSTITVAPSGVDVTGVSVTGTRSSTTRATATVTVRNGTASAVSGVTVTGVWRRNGAQFRTSSATTGSAGTVSISSSTISGARRGDTIQFCVTSLSGTGVTWNQSLSSAALCSTWTVP